MSTALGPWRAAWEAAVERLRRAGVPEAEREAWLLLRLAVAQSRDRTAAPVPWESWLAHVPPWDAAAAEGLAHLVERRARREPFAYLEGFREFFGLRLAVAPAVLIPRPETEYLVSAMLATLPRESPLRLVDVGCGSGAIALALAAWGSPRWRIWATDISPAAVEVARSNARRLGLALAGWWVGDLLPPAPATFDAIAANLPYVGEADRERLPPEVGFEPPLALFAGDQRGLAVIRRLVALLPGRLEPGGGVWLEVGAGQAEPVAAWLEARGLTVDPPIRDGQGIWRVVKARWLG